MKDNDHLSKDRLKIIFGIIAVIFIAVIFWIASDKLSTTKTSEESRIIKGDIATIDVTDKVINILAIKGGIQKDYDILVDQNTKITELVRNDNPDSPELYTEAPVEFQYLKPKMSVSVTLAAPVNSDEESRAEEIKIIDVLTTGYNPKAKGSEGISVSEGSFTVSNMPGTLILDKNNTYKAEAKLTVIPIDDFSATVSFKVGDVLKDGVSIKERGILKVNVSPPSLTSAKYEEGILMSVTSDGAAKGQYIITYSAKSGGTEKHFILPVSVE